MTVNKDDDVIAAQETLDKVYRWACLNNMEFNDLKFIVLRFGNKQELKDNTTYFQSMETSRSTFTMLSRTSEGRSNGSVEPSWTEVPAS